MTFISPTRNVSNFPVLANLIWETLRNLLVPIFTLSPLMIMMNTMLRWSRHLVTSLLLAMLALAALPAKAVVPMNSPYNGESFYIGTPVAFSGGNITGYARNKSYTWIFGDGTSASGQNVSHTYAATGNYTVRYNINYRDDGGDYTDDGSLVTIIILPSSVVIQAQPASTSECQGSQTFFQVSVTGTLPISYQWRKNGVAIQGATGGTYWTPNISASDEGSLFSAVITNPGGSITSANATLTVLLPATVITQPVSTTVVAGHTATFTALATGGGAIGYQWWKNGVAIPGATSASYTTPPVLISDNGAVFAVGVFNSCRPTTAINSNNATLTVVHAPPTTCIQYGYDTQGRLETITYPDLKQVVYSYDDLDRVIKVKRDGQDVIRQITYDGWSNRRQMQFQSGALDQWTYDPSGSLLKQWDVGTVGDLPQSRTYQYDNADRLIQAGEWTTLGYDLNSRLISATGYGFTNSLTPDAYGNNISSVSAGAVPNAMNNYTFNSEGGNQLPALAPNGGLTDFLKSDYGEIVQVATGISTGIDLNASWDALGRLATVQGPNGVSAWRSVESFAYTASGLRVTRVDSAAPSLNRAYAYTGSGLLLSESTANGSLVWNRDVIYLGTVAVAEVDASGAVHELHSDPQGTPRVSTNSAGWNEGSQAYGPYGELLSTSGYVPLTGYTGHVQTEPNGLIYMRGRFYSPAWHRFLNSDQGADPSQLNQYAYCGGNPMLWTDPTGMTEDRDSKGGWGADHGGDSGSDGGDGSGDRSSSEPANSNPALQDSDDSAPQLIAKLPSLDLSNFNFFKDLFDNAMKIFGLFKTADERDLIQNKLNKSADPNNQDPSDQDPNDKRTPEDKIDDSTADSFREYERDQWKLGLRGVKRIS